jgi:hypothetical protein
MVCFKSNFSPKLDCAMLRLTACLASLNFFIFSQSAVGQLVKMEQAVNGCFPQLTKFLGYVIFEEYILYI